MIFKKSQNHRALMKGHGGDILIAGAILLAHLGNCLFHQLSESVAGVLAPDVLHQLGDALCVSLRLKLVTFGFQEHLDVLRIISS